MNTRKDIQSIVLTQNTILLDNASDLLDWTHGDETFSALPLLISFLTKPPKAISLHADKDQKTSFTPIVLKNYCSLPEKNLIHGNCKT